MRIEKFKKLGTPEDFDRIDKVSLYRIFWIDFYTIGQIAKRYDVNKETVKIKLKQHGLTYLSSAMLEISGGEKYMNPKTLERKKRKLEKQLGKKNGR